MVRRSWHFKLAHHPASSEMFLINLWILADTLSQCWTLRAPPHYWWRQARRGGQNRADTVESSEITLRTRGSSSASWVWNFVLYKRVNISLPLSGDSLNQILSIRGIFKRKHPKNCKCSPASPFVIVRQQRLLWIQVLNRQNCNPCLKCRNSLW